MEEKNTQQYIYEQIVGNKRQKIGRKILTTIFLAVLFGGVAAGTFLLVTNAFVTAQPLDAPTLSQDQYGNNSDPKSEPAGTENDENRAIAYQSAADAFVTVKAGLNSPGVLHDKDQLKDESFGIAIAEDSERIYILTENTFLENAQKISVQFGEKEVPAERSGGDTWENLSVLTVLKSQMKKNGIQPETAIIGNSEMIEAGEFVMAGLWADGDSSDNCVPGNVTYIDNQKSTIDGSRRMIYTDSAVFKQNQGVLINRNGEVIGWISKSSRLANDSDVLVAEGIYELKYLIEDMMSKRETAYLGVVGKEVTEENPMPSGLYITEVLLDSPAFLAGLQLGDILVSIAGEKIRNGSDLQNCLDHLISGERVEVCFNRKQSDGYKEMKVKAELSSRP